MFACKSHLTIFLHLFNTVACISLKVNWINGNSKQAQEMRNQFSSDIDAALLGAFKTNASFTEKSEKDANPKRPNCNFEKYANFDCSFVKIRKEVLHVFVFTKYFKLKNVVILLRSEKKTPINTYPTGNNSSPDVTTFAGTDPNLSIKYRKISICNTNVYRHIEDILHNTTIQFQLILAEKTLLLDKAVDLRHFKFTEDEMKCLTWQIKNKSTSLESITYKQIDLLGELTFTTLSPPFMTNILLCKLEMPDSDAISTLYITAIVKKNHIDVLRLKLLGRPTSLIEAVTDVCLRLSWIPASSNRIPETAITLGESKAVKDAMQSAIEMVEGNKAFIMQYKSVEEKKSYESKATVNEKLVVKGNISHYCTYYKEDLNRKLVHAFLYKIEKPQKPFLLVLVDEDKTIIISPFCSDDEFILSLSQAALHALFFTGSPEQAMIWQKERFVGGIPDERHGTQKWLDDFLNVMKDKKAEDQATLQLKAATKLEMSCVRDQYGMMGDTQDRYQFISFELTLPSSYGSRYAIFKLVENTTLKTFELVWVPFLFHSLESGSERTHWFEISCV